MGRQTKISVNLDGLEDLKRKLGSEYYARIGIIGAKAATEHEDRDGEPTGLTNAEIGVLQEFGNEHIPPRSFLRMPIVERMKDIVRFLGSSKVNSLFEAGNIKGIFKALGIEGEGIVQDAFATRGFGMWKPNAPRTIAAKGSDAPLIDTAQLRRSVSSDVGRKSL